MLLEFGAKNFFSFKEGFEVSLRLNNNCPEIISKGNDHSSIACIKGNNASGKTNVLKALSFFKYFCIDSFNLKPEDEVGLESYFNNSEPTEFYIVFEVNGIEYRYELELTKKEIISEVLYKKENRWTMVIKRKFNKFEKTLGTYSELNVMILRKNASFISTSNHYELKLKSIEPVYNFFNSILSNVNLWGLVPFKFNYESISKLYYNDDKLFRFVVKIIKSCDLGINDIKISTRHDEINEEIYYPVFHHKIESNLEKTLLWQHQSSGTKALFTFLILYYVVLEKGGTLVLDEFDINLHPHILPQLIDLFENKHSNRKNAQLIFTTHNSEIMNELGKYRTILVQKDNNNSFTYRLDEIPGDILRNDRPISPVYNSGKIGGVPKI